MHIHGIYVANGNGQRIYVYPNGNGQMIYVYPNGNMQRIYVYPIVGTTCI
jgi:antitoxin component YwqK of YwqJK toxin-antitoxin module